MIWSDTIPSNSIKFQIKSQDKILLVYNVWRSKKGNIHFWHNGGAMYKEGSHNNTITYFCNDGFPDDDFSDLIFDLKLTSQD